MISEPKTDPMPAPDPATPTVAAPAPMNFAAESISFRVDVVCRLRDGLTVVTTADLFQTAGWRREIRTFLDPVLQSTNRPSADILMLYSGYFVYLRI